VSLALLLTVVSNVLGIFTMPFILPHVVAASALGAAGGSSSTAGMLDPVALMLQLCQTILLPTFIGAMIRGIVPGGWGCCTLHHCARYIPLLLLCHNGCMQLQHRAIITRCCCCGLSQLLVT
jgi:predicted Na+-dependent transporter